MNRNRPIRQGRLRSRDNFDRQVDQWIATGRQLVDGVSGTRPGQRKTWNGERGASSSFDKVGRWVGDKIDWLLEDEEDWTEQPQQQSSEIILTTKRPLKAISRRVSNVRSLGYQENVIDDEWPNEELFKTSPWSRDKVNHFEDGDITNTSKKDFRNQRPLPRSSRRRG